VRRDVLQRYPAVRTALSKLEGRIDNETMSSLNYRVDYGKEDPKAVARDFLENAGFSIDTPASGSADIVVGSKNFTEQYILAHLFAFLIESYSDLTVEVKTGLAGTTICFDALTNDELDFYPEYTGTGLLVILDVEDEKRKELMERGGETVYSYVKEEMKKQYDLVWLPPLGFNNTYALMMRSDDAEQFGITTISDLKIYLARR
jgi:osmoprotectant transport system permease protein